MVDTPTARDEIFTRFREDWEAESPAVAGGTAPLTVWQAQEPEDGEPRADKPWCRVTVQHNVSGQRTFGDRRRFERLGIVTVQIFTPLSVEQDLTMAEALAVIARDAFEGRHTPSGVWFRNIRMQEVGPSAPWFQLNVVGEFVYDEVK